MATYLSQAINRTNRKNYRGPYRNKVQHANCNGQPVFDKKLTVQPQQITVHTNLLLRRPETAIHTNVEAFLPRTDFKWENFGLENMTFAVEIKLNPKPFMRK